MVDSIYRTRSLGVPAEGLPDQYADGKAAKVWEYYIGCKQTRTSSYKKWLLDLVKTKGCQTILDVACGTGVDSIMLVEENFNVFSTDASDKMLKYALKERWARRHEKQFDNWVIEEANWLTLKDDIDGFEENWPKDGFDAVICLGNSFAHLPDFEGQLANQKKALENFISLIKPGGFLLIDHRNYDEILATGKVPSKNIYYNSDHIVDIKCSNLYVNGEAQLVTLDYLMDMNIMASNDTKSPGRKLKFTPENSQHHFRLSYYPHQLEKFSALLHEVCGDNYTHTVFGDFAPVGVIDKPAYYIHMVEKK